jgi:hypothetical protein
MVQDISINLKNSMRAAGALECDLASKLDHARFDSPQRCRPVFQRRLDRNTPHPRSPNHGDRWIQTIAENAAVVLIGAVFCAIIILIILSGYDMHRSMLVAAHAVWM